MSAGMWEVAFWVMSAEAIIAVVMLFVCIRRLP